MSDYQQNYSGFPVDPAHASEGNDAERTAYLPPVPAAPAAPHAFPPAGAEETALLPPFQAQPETDPSQAMQSRFGHIEAKYVTGEPPQATYPTEPPAHMPAPAHPQEQATYPTEPPAHMPAAAHPQEQASPWPAGWERPAAPPPSWSPAPQAPGQHSYPAPGDLAPQQPWNPQVQTAGAPLGEPFAHNQGGQAFAAPGHPQPGTPLQTPFGSDGHLGYADAGRAPGAGFAPGQHPLDGPAAAMGPVPGQPPFAQPAVPGGHPQAQHAAYPGPDAAPLAAPQPTSPGTYADAGLAPAGGFAPGQPQPGGPGAGGGSLREAFASAQPTGPGGSGAYAGQAQAYGAYPGQPGGPMAAEQPLSAEGGSLREAFASAEPTGPGRGAPEGVHVGAVLASGQSPLEGGSGSLREAFAEAQPTGPGIAPTASATVAAPQARTGSPIIDPGVQPAAITLVLSALIGVAGLAGKFGLVVPVALLQAVTAAGWFRLNGMWPARQGIALAALGGFVADAAILAASAHSSGPTIIAGTLGAFFLLVLIVQIFRPSDPDERFYALTVCASATVVTVLAGGFLAVGSGKAVLAGALAAGVSAAVSAALRKPPVVGFAAGGFLGLLVGGGLAAATGLGLTEGLLLGLGAGVCALIGRRVAAFDFPSRFVHMTAGVALPLALAAPMVYLIAR